MEVAVDEPRHDRSSLGVDAACVRSAKGLSLGVAPNKKDAVSLDGNRFGVRQVIICCENFGICDEDVWVGHGLDYSGLIKSSL